MIVLRDNVQLPSKSVHQTYFSEQYSNIFFSLFCLKRFKLLLRKCFHVKSLYQRVGFIYSPFYVIILVQYGNVSFYFRNTYDLLNTIISHLTNLDMIYHGLSKNDNKWNMLCRF